VPHCIEVAIEEWAERENGVTVIHARLFVEREGHKAIVIGKGGAVLRDIGTHARKQIEAMLEGPVYLELQVGVRPDWRRSAEETKRLGYA
jgi:GTP-binding protein Era